MPTEKNYKEPNIFSEWFEEYKKFVKSNPRIKYNLCQKTAEMIPEYLEAPLTIDGYICFCYDKGCKSINDYFYNTDNRYAEYTSIFSRIKGVIRNDQISGALVKQYDGNLTARLNGLVDKKDITTEGQKIQPTVLKWGDSEIQI